MKSNQISSHDLFVFLRVLEKYIFCSVWVGGKFSILGCLSISKTLKMSLAGYVTSSFKQSLEFVFLL